MPVVTTAEYVVMLHLYARTRPSSARIRPRSFLSGSGQLTGAQLATVTVMTTTRQAEYAQALADLHKPGEPLLLPNAWDVASAAVIAGTGAKALATTSAGGAWSRGVPGRRD